MLQEELNSILKDDLMIKFESEGNFNNTEKFLKRMKDKKYLAALSKYGEVGVSALSHATPRDTGRTAESWNYEISLGGPDGDAIYWTNSNENKGEVIAILLQYGHGTRNGGYVVAQDYINPAMRDVFEEIAKDVWKEVTS